MLRWTTSCSLTTGRETPPCLAGASGALMRMLDVLCCPPQGWCMRTCRSLGSTLLPAAPFRHRSHACITFGPPLPPAPLCCRDWQVESEEDEDEEGGQELDLGELPGEEGSEGEEEGDRRRRRSVSLGGE